MKKIHLLLVEDNPGDVVLMKRAFKNNGEVDEIVVVDDGEKAIAYVTQVDQYSDSPRPDLILLDLNIPKISGRDVLQKLKSDPSTASIPIIILSSSDSDDEAKDCLANHANSFVRKPVTLEEFNHCVDSLVDYWFTVAKLPAK